jgi:hypothetical protein
MKNPVLLLGSLAAFAACVSGGGRAGDGPPATMRDAGGAPPGTGGQSPGGAGGADPGPGPGGQTGTACGGIRIPMGKDGPSGGAVGVWTNVTPPGISLNGMDFQRDNFGIQDILVDPVRPSDLYMFICHQGVWKSTDYGQTWKKVNTGRNGDRIDSAKPWGDGIDSNRCRDPSTPPTLYSSGSQQGFWRSSNGGVDWDMFKYPEDDKPRPQDAYNVDVDPYDGRHLISAFHEETGLAESFDAGATWRSVTLAAPMKPGVSWYPFFIDTGDPQTTRKTMVMIPQTIGGVGTWRTTDGGVSWTRVLPLEHLHGGAQIFHWEGAVYLSGVGGEAGGGVYRTTDFGATWMQVSRGTQAVVYGTAKYIYAQPAPFGIQAAAVRSPQPGNAFVIWPINTPDGPKRAAVTYDGAHYIIVAGNWQAGAWRYVEP